VQAARTRLRCVYPRRDTAGPGAGAELRQALGTAVFFGMLGVTLFGLMLTPVFYVILRKLSRTEHVTDKHGSHPQMRGIGASYEAQ